MEKEKRARQVFENCFLLSTKCAPDPMAINGYWHLRITILSQRLVGKASTSKLCRDNAVTRVQSRSSGSLTDKSFLA